MRSINNNIQCLLVVLLVLSVYLFRIGKCIDSNQTSPCPRFFTYENNTEAVDRWYGAITLLSDYELNGVWLRVVFDKPVGLIRSNFGDVVPREGNEYLIKDRNFKLLSGIPYTVRFYVQHAFNDTPSNFVGFRLNGRLMCPEIDLKGTTTERLFTSWKDDDFESHLEDTKLFGVSDQHGVLYTASAKVNISRVSTPTPFVSSTVQTEKINGSSTVLFSTGNLTNQVASNVTEEEGTLYVSNKI